MAAVIKSGDWVIASSRKVWTTDELACAAEAAELMEQASEQARQIIAKAEKDGESIRATAQSEGYQAGEVQALRRVLGRLAGQETLVRSVRKFVTEAVAASVATLLASELDSGRYRRLLELVDRTLAGWTWLRLRVAPDAVDEVADVVAGIQGALSDRVKVVADASLQTGECLIESDAGWLDGRLETQLEQIRVAVTEMLDEAENNLRES